MIDWSLIKQLLPLAFCETLYMVLVSSIGALLFGLPLALLLFQTRSRRRMIYGILSVLVNMGRSFPFAIFMIVLIPLTRLIVGTSLGTTASIVPLTIAATPFFARLAENAFSEIDPVFWQSLEILGGKSWQRIVFILLPESLPSLIRAFTTMLVSVTGYSAMAGLIGGGGLGQTALQYGYQRFNTPILIGAVLLLFCLIAILQCAGTMFTNYLLRRQGRL